MKAFKTYAQHPNNLKNIPSAWPWSLQDCSEQEKENLEQQGFTVLTDQQYVEYLATYQNELDSWQATQPKINHNVTNQQLRTALVLISFQQNKPQLHPESIKAFIESMPEPNRSLALQQWEYSNEMIRYNPLILQMKAALGLTDTDLDNIWTMARSY